MLVELGPVGAAPCGRPDDSGTMHRAPTLHTPSADAATPLDRGDLKRYLADREIAVMVVEIASVAEHYGPEEMRRLFNLVMDELYHGGNGHE